LRGLDTHGVSRIPMYLRLLANSDMNPRPEIATVRDTGASVLIEGDRGAGPVVMMQALAAAAAKARGAGIGMALARRTTHTAALGYYTQAAARDGLACIAMAVSSPNMAYHGARAAGVSTSPVSIAVPGEADGPIVFDMSTGVISLGRLMQAAREGLTIPPGSAIDRSGDPTTDGARAHVPLPMAGPKGSGIALMLEFLLSLAASNPLLAESLEGTAEGRRHRQNGMVIAIDLAQFCDPVSYSAQARRLAAAIRALPADREAGGVRLPGERGDALQARRIREGIPLPAGVWSALEQAATPVGVSMPARGL
jgi:LDH2 family malate/lactate/ureidoglycolate dehydrogenase